MRSHNRHAVQRQHRRIPQMKQPQRDRQQRQRAAGQQHAPTTQCIAIVVACQTACCAVVDGRGRDRQHGHQRQGAEKCGQQEHCGKAVTPSQPAGQYRGQHIAGMVGHLVARQLMIEAVRVHQPQGNPGQCRADAGRRQRRGDLRGNHAGRSWL